MDVGFPLVFKLLKPSLHTPESECTERTLHVCRIKPNQQKRARTHTA